MAVKWNRINKLQDVHIRTEVLDFKRLLDSDWNRDAQGNVIAEVHRDKSDHKIHVLINSLFSGLGQSWRPIFEKGGHQDIDLLKHYMEAYQRCSNLDMRIMVDTLENHHEAIHETLRNKLIASPKENRFQDVWDKVKEKFSDSRGLVYGSEDRGGRAEVQLLFGDDIVVKESPQVGDIINKGIFFNLDGGIYLSYGINRLVCTNGLTTQRNLWKDDLTTSLREDSINRIRELADWFCTLPNRKVADVRELSIVFDQFSNKVIKLFWKSWSERIALGNLTFYDVVDDVTRYANQTLGYTRQSCLTIQNNINRLHKHSCPTCSAKIA